MAPTLRISFPTATGASPLSVAPPTGTVAKDIIYLFLVLADNVLPDDIPSGFSLVPGCDLGATGTRTLLYQKQATASEPASYAVRWSGGNNGAMFAVCVHPSGTNYGITHRIAVSSTDVTSASKVWNSVTPSDTNTILLCFGGFAQNGASTPDAAMTERVDTGGSSSRAYLMTQGIAASGATGTRTATVTSASKIRTIAISVSESTPNPFAVPIPHWGELGPGGAAPPSAGWEYTKTLTVSGNPGDGTVDSGDFYAMPLPPTNAVRIKVEGVWSETRLQTGSSGPVPAYVGQVVSAAGSNNTQGGLVGLPKITGATTNGGVLSVPFSVTFTRSNGETDWELSYDDYLATPPVVETGYARFHLDAQVVMGASGNRGATETLSIHAVITEIETEDNVVFIVPEARTAGMGVLVEMDGDGGVDFTEMGVLVEIGAAGVYASEVGALVEIGAVGVYVTEMYALIELEYVEPEVIMPTYFVENAGTRKIHRKLPDEVTGYAFDPEHSWWSSLKPEQSTNLIMNPSFEGWDDTGDCTEYNGEGAIGGLEYVQFPPVGATAGRRCCKLISGPASGGLLYHTMQVTPGPYTFSLDLYVTQAPATIVMRIWDGSGDAAIKSFTVWESGWQRYSLTYVELGSGNRQMRLTFPSSGAAYPTPAGRVFYTDAWQFEAKAYPTTYLDGDMVGFADSSPNQSYYWQGAPHHSPSTRRETTGTGGRIVSWSQEAKFKTTSIIGLGMTAVDQKTQTMGDGREIHLGMTEKGRDFTITGRIFSQNHRQLMQRHVDLMNLLKINNTLGGDQMVVRFQEVDDDEQLVGAALDIVCVYKEGMQGNITGLYQENLPLQFRAVQPALLDIIESSAELVLNKQLVDNGIVYRDNLGDYLNLGTGATLSGVIAQVGFMRSGDIIALGNFTTIAGDVVSYSAVWDGAHWQELGIGASSGPTDIDDGFRLGYPLTVSTSGGDVLEYDEVSGNWVVLGGHGFMGALYSIYRDANGDIWVGGEFTYADDGIELFNNVAHWVAATNTWVPLGEGLTDPSDFIPGVERVNSVLATNDGVVYLAGNFGEGNSSYPGGSTTALASGVIRWRQDTYVFDPMGAGFNLAPNALLRGQDGYIYATGPFGMDGTEHYNLRGFARWTGTIWEEVFPLVRQDGSFGADGMIQDDDGIFWFYNYASDVDNDLFVVEGLGEVAMFGYRNGIFYPPLVANAGARHMALGPGGRLLIAVHRTTAGEVIVAPALNLIDYAGSADAPLAVHLQGPGQFLFMESLSTRGGVYGRDSFVVGENEEILLRTDTQRQMAYSNQRFNLQTQVAAGASNFKALRLRPGINRISILMKDVDDDLSLGWLTWKNRFWGLQETPQ